MAVMEARAFAEIVTTYYVSRACFPFERLTCYSHLFLIPGENLCFLPNLCTRLRLMIFQFLFLSYVVCT